MNLERARLNPDLLCTLAKLQQNTRIYKPAPFQPARRLTDLEARLLSASNGLTDTTRVDRLQ